MPRPQRARQAVPGGALSNATAPTIALHKPHPGNIVKMYVIDDVLRVLTEEGLI